MICNLKIEYLQNGDDEMGRYTRRVKDREEEFYLPVASLLIVAAILLFLVALFGALETDSNSRHMNEENNLHLALQGKEVNDSKALATVQVIRSMYSGEFNDWLYLGSLMGDQNEINNGIDNDHNAINFAVRNWNETVEYLEDPDKAIPENHIWKNALDWFLKFASVVTLIAVNAGYIIGAFERPYSNLYKYPWKEKWALPWAIPLMPYILLTQPFVLLHMIIREPLEFGYRAIIAWNDHLESVQVRSTITSTEEPEPELEPVSEPEPRLRSISFERHSDYVRSKNETRNLEKQFEEIVSRATENIENSKKNFEIFYKNVLKREMDNKRSSIRSFRDKLSTLGSEIEIIQREILKAAKQEKDIESKIALVDPEKTAEEFEKILNLPLVEAVEISDESNVVNIYTKKVFIDYNGKRFEIGNFLISLNIRYHSKDIKNLTSTTNYTRHHPYNSRDFSTSFCFGKTDAVIYKALSDNNILLATALILQALQTGEGDSTEKIDYWRKVKKVK